MQEILAEGIEKLGIPFERSHTDRLGLYIEEIERWNRRINLVRANRQELIIKHILDSLSGFPTLSRLDRKGSVADIGSGAGFPGIPLSLFMPDAHFTLIERSAKKAGFLHSCVNLLHLSNVRILERNLREIHETFDIVLFRAFARLSDRQMRLVERITHPDGVIASYKGRHEKIQEELGDNRHRYRSIVLIPLDVPFLNEERHLVLLQIKNTIL